MVSIARVIKDEKKHKKDMDALKFVNKIYFSFELNFSTSTVFISVGMPQEGTTPTTTSAITSAITPANTWDAKGTKPIYQVRY